MKLTQLFNYFFTGISIVLCIWISITIIQTLHFIATSNTTEGTIENIIKNGTVPVGVSPTAGKRYYPVITYTNSQQNTHTFTSRVSSLRTHAYTIGDTVSIRYTATEARINTLYTIWSTSIILLFCTIIFIVLGITLNYNMKRHALL